MFQKIATIFIQRFLNRFIYKLEQEKLNISVWNGTASLKDIKLKSYSFLSHGIPLKIDEGSKIGDFYLKLNWAKLSTEKIIIKIDNIDIFLSPTEKTGFSENIEADENSKKTKLDAWEEFYFSAENEADGDSTEGYMKKYIVKIINNLEISVTNINVRLTSPVLNQLNQTFNLRIPEIVIQKEKQDNQSIYEENKKLNVKDVEFFLTETDKDGKETNISMIDPISTSLYFRWTRDLKKLEEGNSAYRLDGIINSIFLNLDKKSTHCILYLVRELLLLVKHFSEIKPTKFAAQNSKEQLKEFLLKQFLLYKDNTIQLEKNYGQSAQQKTKGFYNKSALTGFFGDKQQYIKLYMKRFNISGFYENSDLEELKKLEVKHDIGTIIYFRKCAFLKAYTAVPRSFFNKIRIPEKRPKYFLKQEQAADKKVQIEEKLNLFKEIQNAKFSVIKKSLVKFENIQGKNIVLFSGDFSIQSVSVNILKSETKPLLMTLLSELSVNVSARGDDLFFNTNLEKFSIYSAVISSSETIEILKPLDTDTLLNISLGLIKNENKVFLRVISNAVEMVYSHKLVKEIKEFLPPKGFFRELEASASRSRDNTDSSNSTSTINYGIKDLNKLFANKKKLELDIKMEAPVLNIIDVDNPIKFKMGCLKVFSVNTFEDDEDYRMVKKTVENNYQNYIKPLRYQRNNIKVEFTQTNLSINDQNINSKLDLNLFIGLNSRKDKKVFIDITGMLKGIEIDFRTDFIVEVLRIINIHKEILETPDKTTGEKLFLESEGISTKKPESSTFFYHKSDKSTLNVNFLVQSIRFKVFNAENSPWTEVNVSNILVSNYQKNSYDQTMLIMEDVMLKVLDPLYEHFNLRLHKIKAELPPFTETTHNNETVLQHMVKNDKIIILHSYIESLKLTYQENGPDKTLGVVKALEVFVDDPIKNIFLEILNSKITLTIADFNRILLLYIFVMKQVDGVVQLIDSITSETYIDDNQLAEKVMRTFKSLSSSDATKHPLFLSLQKQIFFELKSFEVNLNAIEGDSCIDWKFDKILINFLVVPYVYTEILLRHYKFSIHNRSTLPRYKDFKECYKTFLSLNPNHTTEEALEIKILSYLFNPSSEVDISLNELFWVHTFFTWEIIEFVLAIQETEGINKLIEMDAVIKSLGFEDTKPLNIKMNIDEMTCFIPIDPKNSLSESITTHASLKLNFLFQSNDDVVISLKSKKLNVNTTYLTEQNDNSFKATPINESSLLVDINTFTGVLVYNLINLNTTIAIDIPRAFSSVSREDILLVLNMLRNYSVQDELHANYSIFRKASFEVINETLNNTEAYIDANKDTFQNKSNNNNTINNLICLKESLSFKLNINTLCFLINDDFSAKKSPFIKLIIDNFDGSILQKASTPITADFKTKCSVDVDFFNNYQQTWQRELSSFRISTDSRMTPFGRFINRVSISDTLYFRVSEQVIFQMLDAYHNFLGILENNKEKKVSDYLYRKIVLLENKLSFQHATKKLKVINLTGQKVHLSKFKKTIKTKYGEETVFLESPTEDRSTFRQKKHSEIYLSEAKLQTPAIDLFEKSTYKFKIPFKFNKEKHFQTFFIRTYAENGAQTIKFHSNFALVNATNFEFYTKDREIKLVPNSKEYLPFDIIYENKIKLFCKEIYNTKSQRDVPVELLLNSKTINIVSIGDSNIQTRPYYSESLDLNFILIYSNLEIYNHVYSTMYVKLTEETGSFKQQNFELKHKDKEIVYAYKTTKNLKLDLAIEGYRSNKGMHIGNYLSKKPVEYKCAVYNNTGCSLIINILSIKSNKSIFLRKLFKRLFEYEVDEFNEFKAMLEVIEIHIFSRVSILNLSEKAMSINPSFVLIEQEKSGPPKNKATNKISFSKSRSSYRPDTLNSLTLQNKTYKPIGYTNEHKLYFKFDFMNCKWCSFKFSKIKTDRDYDEDVYFTPFMGSDSYEAAKIVLSVTNESIVVSDCVLGESNKMEKFYRPLLSDFDTNLSLKRHIKTTIITVSPMFKFINNLDIKVKLLSHDKDNGMEIEVPPKSHKPVYMDISVFKNKKLEKLNFEIEFPSKTKQAIEIDLANHNNFSVEGYDEEFNIITYPTGGQTIIALNRIEKDNIKGVLENLTPFKMFIYANGRLDSLIEPYSTKGVESHSHKDEKEYYLCTKNGVYMTKISFEATNLNSFVNLNESNHFNKIKSYSIIGLNDPKDNKNQVVYEKEKSIIVYKYRSKGRTIFVILNKQIEFKKIISDLSFKYRDVFKYQSEYLQQYADYSSKVARNKEIVKQQITNLHDENPRLYILTVDKLKGSLNSLEFANIHISHRDSGSIIFDLLSENKTDPVIIELKGSKKKQRVVFIMKKSLIEGDCLVIALETPLFKSRGVEIPISTLNTIGEEGTEMHKEFLFRFENTTKLKIAFEKVPTQQVFNEIDQEYYNAMIRKSLKKRNKLLELVYSDQELSFRRGFNQGYNFVDYYFGLTLGNNTQVSIKEDISAHALLLVLQLKENPSVSSFIYLKRFNDQKEESSERNLLFLPASFQNKFANISIFQEYYEEEDFIDCAYSLKRKLLKTEDFVVKQPQFHFSFILTLYYVKSQVSLHLDFMVSFGRPLDVNKQYSGSFEEITREEENAIRIIRELPEKIFQVNINKLAVYYDITRNGKFLTLVSRKISAELLSSDTCYYSKLALKSLRLYIIKLKKNKIKKFLIYKKIKKDTEAFRISLGGYYDNYTDENMKKLYHPALNNTFEVFAVEIAPFIVYLENNLLNVTLRFLKTYKEHLVGRKRTNSEFIARKDYPKQIKEIIKYNEEIVESFMINEADTCYYFNLLKISPISFKAAFMIDSDKVIRNLADIRIAEAHQIRFMLNILEQIAIDELPLSFDLIYTEDLLANYSELSNKLSLYYKSQFLFLAPKIIGSLTILGNPVNLFSNLKQGVSDAFVTPTKNAKLGASQFIDSLSIGTASLVGHAMAGVGGSLSGISSSVSNLLSSVSLDPNYLKKRKKLRKKHLQSTPSIGRALRDAAINTANGVTGLFTKPVESINNEGAKGVITGLGKGIGGLLSKPFVSIFDVTSEVFKKITHGGKVLISDTRRAENKRKGIEDSDSSEDFVNEFV